jgi:hypothetical protein
MFNEIYRIIFVLKFGLTHIGAKLALLITLQRYRSLLGIFQKLIFSSAPTELFKG